MDDPSRATSFPGTTRMRCPPNRVNCTYTPDNADAHKDRSTQASRTLAVTA